MAIECGIVVVVTFSSVEKIIEWCAYISYMNFIHNSSSYNIAIKTIYLSVLSI
jgi:hypothetical protein